MKILVTGGAGFIGSHICTLLIEQGHEVLVYDNLSRGKKENIHQQSLFIQGDLENKELLTKCLSGVDAVIHMAALIEVGESVKYPEEFVKNNVLGSLFLLESMKEAGVKKVIFSSTASVYDFNAPSPLTEESKILAANPYGASKIAVENLMSSYNFNFGFDVVVLRYFNAYGPGEDHHPETHAIPNFVRAALKREKIPLYWKGEQVRDFVYVEDLSKAHMAVLDLKGWNAFNVGTEKGVRVTEVLNMISDILGYQLEIDDLGERKGDVRECFASSRKLAEATGWKFETELRAGLEKTISWFKDNPS